MFMQKPFDYYVRKESERGCWLWMGCKSATGAGLRWIVDDGVRKIRMAHRVQWERTFGEIPKNMNVYQKCLVKNCVNPKHLIVESKKTAIRKRFKSKGGRLLIRRDVRRIGKLFANGIRQIDIAKEFGISRALVHAICQNKLWGYIQ